MQELKKQKSVEQEMYDNSLNFHRESLKHSMKSAFESKMSDPEELHFHLNYADVFADTVCSPFYSCVEVLGHDCAWDLVIEGCFLNWMNLYLNKGLGFEEAWILAQRALARTGDNRIAQYELEEADHYEVELWMERLADFGMSQEKLEPMAKDIVRLLRRLYLSSPGSWFSEEDELKSRELLGDLWSDEDEQALKADLT